MLDSRGTTFYKLSGAGNDFIALVLEGDAEPLTPERVSSWCRRGLSLGADGVMTLRRTEGGARMVHWNADGSRAALCLNGSRAAIRLAFELGWADDTGPIRLETDAGTLVGRRPGTTRCLVTLPGSIAGSGDDDSTIRAVRLEIAGDLAVDGHYLVVGVPHLVVAHDDLDALPIDRLGPPLRHHERFGGSGPDGGANVDFVTWPKHDEPMHLRTWERGVEGETLACGTGVVAAVRTGLHLGRVDLPARVLTSGGFELVVDRDAEGRTTLEGDARIVARGELFDEADASASAGH